ncbi:MAG: N-acetylneuraminate synthase family protein [Candidatus Thermoplasmatota archaeon]
MKEIKIADKKIGKNNPCFVIAEAGVNHNGKLKLAKKLVDAAVDAGADAVKFQTFKAEELQFKGTDKPKYQQENTEKNVDYFDLLKSLESNYKDQVKIARYCKKKGIIFLSTPYERDSVDFLDKKINVPAFKLASIELTNHRFIKYIAHTGKPIILSTGLGNMANVEKVVKIARRDGFANRLILLQCTSDYPTKPSEINLKVLNTFQEKYPDILFGFSDHTPNDVASIGAVSLGAVIVEKHFTLDRNLKGPDHSSSLEPKELKEWINHIRIIEKSLGSEQKFLTCSEKGNLSMKKYLVIGGKHKKGEMIKDEMLTEKRTGRGILPMEENLEKIIGKKLKMDIGQESILTWDMIE